MQYEIDYFIEKFKAIPEENWATGDYIQEGGKYCAYGHCGARGGLQPLTNTPESISLMALAVKYNLNIVAINDATNFEGIKFPQKTPKQRVLEALRLMKQMQIAEDRFMALPKEIEVKKVEEKQVIKYVAVPATLTEKSKELLEISN